MISLNPKYKRPFIKQKLRWLRNCSRSLYNWFDIGWTSRKRVRAISVYVRIKNEKIHIEEDWTEEGIATELLREGVPKEDIVLAFYSPEKRKYTEFAIA
ncbi:MAG: XisI protein [Roseofilum sp. Belize BBD 4]|nr:XisI protein [Roseofilum sp. Belize Diploria]MBP0034059.1 XisI protein [Roseofilum sp. Belize BBD 4]HBQ97707.1 hypothetical protein [Cyanobacteria bacterium UBA11691]